MIRFHTAVGLLALFLAVCGGSGSARLTSAVSSSCPALLPPSSVAGSLASIVDGNCRYRHDVTPSAGTGHRNQQERDDPLRSGIWLREPEVLLAGTSKYALPDWLGDQTIHGGGRTSIDQQGCSQPRPSGERAASVVRIRSENHGSNAAQPDLWIGRLYRIYRSCIVDYQRGIATNGVDENRAIRACSWTTDSPSRS